MASLTTEVCLLCKCDVSQGTYKVKRKKMNGKAASAVRKIFDKFSEEQFRVSFSDCIQLKSLFICHNCKQRVEKLPELLKTAEKEKNAMLGMYLALPKWSRKRNRSQSQERSMTESEETSCTAVPETSCTAVPEITTETS